MGCWKRAAASPSSRRRRVCAADNPIIGSPELSAPSAAPLFLAYAAAACTLLSGAVSLFAVRRHPGFLHFGSFLFLFAAGAASIAAGAWVLLGDLTLTDRLALGLVARTGDPVGLIAQTLEDGAVTKVARTKLPWSSAALR